MTRAPDPSAIDPSVSAVVCTYDRYETLAAAIRSIEAQTLARDRFEIVVVDNSPDQARAARMAENYRAEPRLRYVLQPEPGAANARNTGARAARAAIVAFADDDVIVDPGWLQAILDAFAAFPGAGVVGGRVRLRFDGGRPVWLPDALLNYLSKVDLGDSRRIKAPAEWFASANMAMARDAFEAVRGFSLALGRRGAGLSLLSNEDIDIVDRIVALGRPAIYAPDAVVVHPIDPARLSPRWFRRRAAWQAVSDFLSRPEAAAKSSPGAAARLRLLAQSRKSHPPGFFTEPPDATAMLLDTQTAYYAAMALMAGGVEIDADWIESFAREPKRPDSAQADSSSESQ